MSCCWSNATVSCKIVEALAEKIGFQPPPPPLCQCRSLTFPMSVPCRTVLFISSQCRKRFPRGPNFVKKGPFGKNFQGAHRPWASPPLHSTKMPQILLFATASSTRKHALKACLVSRQSRFRDLRSVKLEKNIQSICKTNNSGSKFSYKVVERVSAAFPRVSPERS